MSKSIYFPGLNGLRFFAALAVIFTHVELMKMKLGLPHMWQEPLFFELGSLGVYFFFVLSGFLITYLLLVEHEEHEKIAIKDFYVRRILRIWPLYFLIVLLGFIILPNIEFFHVPRHAEGLEVNFWGNFGLYMIIFPNLAFSIYPAVPLIGQAWSIGVEEQFYIIWPWLFRRIKNILKKILLFTIILLVLKVVFLFVHKAHPDVKWIASIKLFLAMSKMENMAIGGLGAYVLFKKKDKILQLIYHPIVQVLSIILPFVLIYFTPQVLQDGIHIPYAFLFLFIILNVSTNKKSIIKLENKVFKFLGKISYGLYMYHLIAVFIVLKLLCVKQDLSSLGFVNNVLIYGLAILLSILIAGISYRFFEKPFIKRKLKFSKIVSGDNAKAAKRK